LIDGRHRALSKNLIKNSNVKLYGDLTDEYLYEVLSEMSDTHLFETIKQIDSFLPIYSVSITDSSTVDIIKLQ